MPLYHPIWAALTSLVIATGFWQNTPSKADLPAGSLPESASMSLATCNCSITQAGNTYPINALQGTESAPSFYSYGTPNGSSANTGLELSNGLIIFLYEDTNTGIISLFIIADIANDGTGGSMQFELSCLPNSAFVSVQDDAGEFSGSPPVITGNWSWSDCCTDGGVIEDIGCNNTVTLDLLVSSGLDSIVWLTGDINSPTQILLSTGGEAITMDCGGSGICCPLTLDTDAQVMDATCPDTPNGSITLAPQDGIGPYDYIWDNGETTPVLSGLYPGNYGVTVTDSQGCTEELVVIVSVSPGDPLSAPASIELCSGDTEDYFDLTSVEDEVNLGTGDNVHWYMNADLTGPINNPGNYYTGSTTVYAVVDNGFCLSIPVPVDLILIQIPIANPTSVSLCEEDDEQATFDLTSLENTVSGGTGNVDWYEDILLTNQINNPSSYTTESTIVYATVIDGDCVSEPVEVELHVDLKPLGNPASITLCEEADDEATFDLASVEMDINSAPNITFTWYLEIELEDQIFNINSFVTTTTTVYAVLFDGICYSDPVPVVLIVQQTPEGNAITIDACDNGAGEAVFDLVDNEMQVSGGTGGVDWYLDINLLEPVPAPDAFQTESTIVFAVVDNGTCVSDPVPINLNVIESPIGNPASLSTCADSSGMGEFNLTSLNNEVSGGTGDVFWFEDSGGNFPISDTLSYNSSGSIVYAQVIVGPCASPSVPVNLIIINTVSATPTSYAACDDGSGIALFDLTAIDTAVSHGTGVVDWYIDSLGVIPILPADSFPTSDTTVFARVTAGSCVSDFVAVDLSVINSPLAMGLDLHFCGDTLAQAVINLTSYDTVVNGHVGIVTWYGDSALNTIILNANTFATGDTTVYAVVTNGSCRSSGAIVNITVTQGVIANPGSFQICVPQSGTATVDLTQSDVFIGGGLYPVNWFLDQAGSQLISSPSTYSVDTSTTVYANITNQGCPSPLIAVPITAFDMPTANSFSLLECGDTNGQVLFDLVATDPLVSNGTGVVNWYNDATLTMPIVNPNAFLTGDATVFAQVVNGFCYSPVVPIMLDVTDSLVANPITIEECLLDQTVATIDLTQSDLQVSGGNGNVTWFSDAAGNNPIANPTSYSTSGGTVYAMVTSGSCVSNLALIAIEVATSSYPVPSCTFSSIDSLAISWTAVNDSFSLNYTVNGIPVGSINATDQTTFNLGGLGQGDTLTLTITALFDSICTSPLSANVTCITDVCPVVNIDLSSLNATYCRDEAYVVIHPVPSGGILSGNGISGDTLFPGKVVGNNTTINYHLLDPATNCVYDAAANVNIVNPLVAPNLSCASSGLDSVSFAWNSTGSQFGYQYQINNGALTSSALTNQTSLNVKGLNQGDQVTLYVWTIGSLPCGNSDTVSIACTAKSCPAATINIQNAGPFCSNEVLVDLEVSVNGTPGSPVITWSGNGITDLALGIFNPQIAGPGNHVISVSVNDSGCQYSGSKTIRVIETPILDYDISGIPCQDSILSLDFTGTGFYPTSTQYWNLDGGSTSFYLPPDEQLWYETPGIHTVEIAFGNEGCISDTFVYVFSIDAPLDSPFVLCADEDYFSLAVEWDPVPGATGYAVTSSQGTGTLSGTTYKVTNLKDDTDVDVTVQALGPTACGPSESTITCHTNKLIPISTFIPDVFSPNHDGVNDIFYVQTNTEVTAIKLMRIYDRWGNLVFEKINFPPNDPADGWDGTFQGKQLNPAVFTYWIQAETTRGIDQNYVGDVTIIR